MVNFSHIYGPIYGGLVRQGNLGHSDGRGREGVSAMLGAKMTSQDVDGDKDREGMRITRSSPS
jgi:hypothetical protein